MNGGCSVPSPCRLVSRRRCLPVTSPPTSNRLVVSLAARGLPLSPAPGAQRSRRRKAALLRPPPTWISTQMARGAVEVFTFSLRYLRTLPPLPQGAPSPVFTPPLPKGTPPLTPSASPQARVASAAVDEDTLTLEELEEQQRRIWAALEQAESTHSDSDLPVDTPLTGNSVASSPGPTELDLPGPEGSTSDKQELDLLEPQVPDVCAKKRKLNIARVQTLRPRCFVRRRSLLSWIRKVLWITAASRQTVTLGTEAARCPYRWTPGLLRPLKFTAPSLT